MNLVEGTNESNLFKAHTNIIEVSNNVWRIDIGCSNHMTERKEAIQRIR